MAELCETVPLLDVALYNALFFMSLSLSASAVAVSVACFGEERAFYLRERASGASSWAYFLGKVG